MGRGEQTREHIVERAAALFNQRGFAGASIADVMEATGLKKGGIYRHFESKEALAVEAFDFAAARMAERFAAALEGRRGAVERLRAVAGVYATIAVDPPVPGGCPVMNAAVDHDDGNPQLRARARAAMDGLRALVRRVVEAGVRRGEIRPETDPEQVATVLTAMLEGAVMLSQLYDDPAYARRAVRHVEAWLEAEVRA